MSRVLVIEPDRRIRNFIAGILSDFGHHVQQCRDPADARRWLGRARFDVVATDLVLDDETGDFPDLAQRVRVLTLSGRLFRSAFARHEQAARLNDKPFRLADLRSLVAAIGEPELRYAPAA